MLTRAGVESIGDPVKKTGERFKYFSKFYFLLFTIFPRQMDYNGDGKLSEAEFIKVHFASSCSSLIIFN